MIKFTAKIIGVKELSKGMLKMSRELAKGMKAPMRESLAWIEREAKLVTPVDTGHLRRSILPDFIKPFSGAISPHTNYAIFVHEGTYRMMGRPFMKKGLEKAAPKIDKLFEGTLRKVMKKSFRSKPL